ncbi:MAG: cation:proton antiporter [Candidatus Marinimicrobia bacterium]|nr:cation:proton antiporter [FCB group bacterium]MBL7026175.1 cation:proton antiporter [Candidatus Neomarinimicrobiota bacterium]
MDPILPIIAGVAFAILILGLVLNKMKQPQIIGYIVVGVILGPHVLDVIHDLEVMNRMGSVGVLLLLFFVGMEVSLPRLLKNWRVVILGTILQIVLSVLVVLIIGHFVNWPIGRSILLGFVISLSSTAVVIKILQEWKQLDSEIGRDVLGILLVQDMAIIPMLIIINIFGGKTPSAFDIGLQLIGGVLMIALLVFILKRGQIKLPLSKLLKQDHELQVFFALVICLGMALITDLFQLSTALGAFLAGILISSAKETDWVHRVLEPFHVVFLSFFFVSIGFLLDLQFLADNFRIILLLAGAAFIINTFINAFILRIFSISWPRSLYTGAILAQIGEFSFVLAAVGWQVKMISETGYQLSLAVISVTLLLSPLWIISFRRLTRQ